MYWYRRKSQKCHGNTSTDMAYGVTWPVYVYFKSQWRLIFGWRGAEAIFFKSNQGEQLNNHSGENLQVKILRELRLLCFTPVQRKHRQIAIVLCQYCFFFREKLTWICFNTLILTACVKILWIQNNYSKTRDLLIHVIRSKSHILPEQLNLSNRPEMLYSCSLLFFFFLIRQMRGEKIKQLNTAVCVRKKRKKSAVCAYCHCILMRRRLFIVLSATFSPNSFIDTS